MTEPLRKTCLAVVAQIKGDWFTVDRALFAPKSKSYRHPQNPDKGTIWIDGEKRRLAGVKDENGTVWYRLRGTTPAPGEKLQCELDQGTRDEAARAHAAMHLIIAAVPGALVTDPEVKGGGHFRLVYQAFVAPKALAGAVAAANQAVEADTPIATGFLDKAHAKATTQSFTPPDPVPGPDPAPFVTIGATVMPCDGAFPDRTGRIGRVAIVHARMGRDGFVVTGRVTD